MATDKRKIGTKIAKDEKGRRTVNFQVWLKDPNSDGEGRPEDGALIDMLEHCYNTLKWDTREIANAAFNLLHEKLANGESVATTLGTGKITQQMITLLEQAMEMQAKALKVLEALENVDLSQASRNEMKADLLNQGGKLLKTGRDAGINILPDASDFAGELYFNEIDDDEEF